jgi:Tfp pilus assembly protein PilF
MSERDTRAVPQCGISGRSGRAALGLLLAAVMGLAGCVTTTDGDEGGKDEKSLAAATRDVGIDHLAQGRTAMAIRKLKEAMSHDPDDPSTHLWLGDAYRRKGMFSEAEAELLISLKLNPDTGDFNHQETVLNLSALYIQMKRYADTRALCQSLVDNPTFSTPWRALTNRGWAEYKLGEFAEARASYEEALDFHPRYSPAHFNLGILDQRERHFLDALRRFELALDARRLSPDGEAEANYRMAEVYVSLGRRGKAIEHFSMAVERSPYGQWGSQSKSYLELLR